MRLRRLLGYTRRQMYLLTHPLAEFSVAGIFSIPDSRRLSGLREGGGLVDCGWHDIRRMLILAFEFRLYHGISYSSVRSSIIHRIW